MGHKGILTNRLCEVPSCLHSQFILQLSVVMAPFLVLYLRSLGNQEEDQSFFPSLLDFDCFQLEIICIPKGYFWGGKFCSLNTTMLYPRLLHLMLLQTFTKGLVCPQQAPPTYTSTLCCIFLQPLLSGWFCMDHADSRGNISIAAGFRSVLHALVSCPRLPRLILGTHSISTHVQRTG